MIKFILMMMIILILMKTSTTNRLMWGHSHLIPRSPPLSRDPPGKLSSRISRIENFFISRSCNKMKELHYLRVVVLETGAFCERERMPLLVLIKVTFKNTGLH